jgi:hypothetical protein
MLEDDIGEKNAMRMTEQKKEFALDSGSPPKKFMERLFAPTQSL